MEIKRKIASLEALIKDPSKGLAKEVFLFASRIVPLVNVDLLIKNEKKQTLLTWRDDGYCPAGWHIPGGVVRYKELLADRIKAVAGTELRAKVAFSSTPLAINEFILPELKNRAHGISLLFECSLTSPLDEKFKYIKDTLKCVPKKGQWAWHSSCPENIITVHEIFRRYF